MNWIDFEYDDNDDDGQAQRFIGSLGIRNSGPRPQFHARSPVRSFLLLLTVPEKLLTISYKLTDHFIQIN